MDYDSKFCRDAALSLSAAFAWDDHRFGYSFWQKAHDELLNMANGNVSGYDKETYFWLGGEAE